MTSGLADLDHVELYFRRNGLGTFSRYTGRSEPATASTTPQCGAVGTIVFDATRMGGDGAYEFFTVGVDKAGNREAPPEDAGAIVGDAGVDRDDRDGRAGHRDHERDTEIASDVLAGQNLRVDGATLTLVGAAQLRQRRAAERRRAHAPRDDADGGLRRRGVGVDAQRRRDESHRRRRARLSRRQQARVSARPRTPAASHPARRTAAAAATAASAATTPATARAFRTRCTAIVANPVDLGSGGGAWSGDGGDGGGRVLIGAINLVVDGAIRANGALSSGSASGEGSGGSVNLTLRTLSGRGAIAADGGTTNGSNHTGGGGGRIAVRSLDRATYDASRLTARGGDGYYADGADGTIFLLGEGETGGELVINGVGASSPITDLIIPPGQSFASITLQNGANVIAQGPIVLGRGAAPARQLAAGASDRERGGPLDLRARSDHRERLAIDVTGRGYLGGNKAGSRRDGAHARLQRGFAERHRRQSRRRRRRLRRQRREHADAGLRRPEAPEPARRRRRRLERQRRRRRRRDPHRRERSPRRRRRDPRERRALVGLGFRRRRGRLDLDRHRNGSPEPARSRPTAEPRTAATTRAAAAVASRSTRSSSIRTPNLAGLRNVTARGGDGFYGDGAAGTVFLHAAGRHRRHALRRRRDGRRADRAGRDRTAADRARRRGGGHRRTRSRWTAPCARSRRTRWSACASIRNSRRRRTSRSRRTRRTRSRSSRRTRMASRSRTSRRPVATYAGAWHFDDVALPPRRLPRAGRSDLRRARPRDRGERAAGASRRRRRTTPPISSIEAGTISIDATSRIDVTGRGYLGGNRTGLGETAHTLGFAPGAQSGSGGSHGGLGGDYASNGASVPDAAYGNPD